MAGLFRKRHVLGKVCAVLFLVVCAYFFHGSFGGLNLGSYGEHGDARVVLSKQLPVHDAVFKSSHKQGDLQSSTPLKDDTSASLLSFSSTIHSNGFYNWLYLLFDGTIFSRDYA